MTRGRALIASLLAFAVALAPVAAPIHQAFADHRHVYCPRHQRFEDAGPRDAVVALPANAIGRHAREERPVCDLSNVFLQLAPAGRPLPLAGGLDASGRDLRRALLAPLAPIALCHLAPKHSPPLALA